jgi:peptidoglycan/LPS O-acetylase OafA/YrhL
MFFASSLPRYIIDGPFVGNMTSEVRKCHKWWWSSLLFIQNYMNLKENCLNHTWYLSVDWQLFLVTPVIVGMLWKFGRKFLVVMIVTIVALQYLTFDDLEK